MMSLAMEGRGTAVEAESSFYRLYDAEAPAVLRYIRAAVRDHALAEDLCGDAFCRAWDAWPRFRGNEAEARAWVFRIARNLVIDRVRRDGRVRWESLREPHGIAGADDPVGTAASGHVDMRRATDRLGRDDRDLLAMRVAGLSHAEIARVQGRSEEAVKKAWQRALLRLRQELEA